MCTQTVMLPIQGKTYLFGINLSARLGKISKHSLLPESVVPNS